MKKDLKQYKIECEYKIYLINMPSSKISMHIDSMKLFIIFLWRDLLSMIFHAICNLEISVDKAMLNYMHISFRQTYYFLESLLIILNVFYFIFIIIEVISLAFNLFDRFISLITKGLI